MKPTNNIIEHNGRKFYTSREAADKKAQEVGGYVVEEKIPAEESTGRVNVQTKTGRFYVEAGSGVTYPH